MKQNSHRVVGLLILCVAVILSGCDPGYDLVPIEGARTSGAGWVVEDENVRLEFLPPGGLVGSRTLTAGFTAESLTRSEISFLGVTLTSGQREYKSTFGTRDGREITEVRVPAGSRERVQPVHFLLDEPLRAAVGERVTMTVQYRVGDGLPQALTVNLRRQHS